VFDQRAQIVGNAGTIGVDVLRTLMIGMIQTVIELRPGQHPRHKRLSLAGARRSTRALERRIVDDRENRHIGAIQPLGRIKGMRF